MQSKILNIKPGHGLGDLEFGMTIPQVEVIIGKPDELEKGEFSVPNEDDEIFMQTWHYDKTEVSMEFELIEEEFRLIVLSVTGEQYLYKDEKLIGRKYDELKPILEDLYLVKDEAEQEGVSVFFSNLLNISFWFDEDILTEVQWSQVLQDFDFN